MDSSSGALGETEVSCESATACFHLAMIGFPLSVVIKGEVNSPPRKPPHINSGRRRNYPVSLDLAEIP
jgi:hypothetical protein